MPNEHMPSVDRVKLTVLVEDSVGKPDLEDKHGLSLLSETASADSNSRVLMDAGPPPELKEKR